MGYLIVHEIPPEREKPARLVGSQRHPKGEPSYASMRALIQKLYPNHQVFSPLENCDGGTILVLFTSGEKDNKNGRQGSALYHWKVKEIPI